MNPKRATFLNLDMELDSGTDLAPLGEHLAKSGHILFNGRVKRAYRLCVEPVFRGKFISTPSACTVQFLDVLEQMPARLRKMFRECKRRVFDYGFDGGLESPPLSAALENEHLARMAKLGIEVRITVYPYRKASDA